MRINACLPPVLLSGLALISTGCSKNTPNPPTEVSNRPPAEVATRPSAQIANQPSAEISNQPAAASAKFFPVKPVASSPMSASPSSGDLQIGRGQSFSYVLPAGWRVGEDGQFALTLIAPDNKALTVMTGNAGYPPNYPPARFVYEKLMSIRPENLQLSQPRQAAPVAGFSHAYEFDVMYTAQGAPCRGIARCHIAPAYDTCVMAMTAALADATQWPGYATWLPLVADQISATNGAAFGMRGIMAQNIQNSTAYGEAARQYRDWSQRNWQQVTNDRNASVDRRNFETRENLGAVQSYVNPYDPRGPVALSTQYRHYWVDRQGNVVGTDDPSANPNVGSTGEWTQMKQYRP